MAKSILIGKKKYSRLHVLALAIVVGAIGAFFVVKSFAYNATPFSVTLKYSTGVPIQGGQIAGRCTQSVATPNLRVGAQVSVMGYTDAKGTARPVVPSGFVGTCYLGAPAVAAPQGGSVTPSPASLSIRVDSNSNVVSNHQITYQIVLPTNNTGTRSGSTSSDTDRDGTPDSQDTDDDNDGAPDVRDVDDNNDGAADD